MKGVIVQIGEPKSIVLFNDGKIRAIPTPPDCHVGMVVTVKLNNRLKIIVISLAAFLLVALGVFIGTSVQRGRPFTFSPLSEAWGGNNGGISVPQRESGRGKRAEPVTAAQVKNLPDDTEVLLTGRIVESLGDERYTFRDSTGEVTVEIDKKLWRGFSVDESDTVEISGEVDVERSRIVVDVKSIRKV